MTLVTDLAKYRKIKYPPPPRSICDRVAKEARRHVIAGLIVYSVLTM